VICGMENIKSSFPFFDDDSIRGILSETELTLRSGVLTHGPRVKEFELKFAAYTKAKHAVAFNSGTSNIEMALRYFGTKNREVIVPTNTFIATPNSVLFAGGKPVFADMLEETLCLDPADVEKKITPKTAGVIVVHLSGLICPQVDELSKLCEDHNLFLLEDCAHAHGAMIDQRMAGTLSNAGCFSFYPTKIMTTGEGGMLVTDDEKLAEKARLMRDHGQNSQRLMVTLGHNWCMSEVTAILGKYQLANLESFVLKRNEVAKLYTKYLKQTEGISLFKTPSNIRHSYYKYPIKLDDDVDAEKLAGTLREEYGIETGSIYYPPCHLQPFYRENFGTGDGDFPVAEKVLGKVLCLPMHACITEEQVRYIANALKTSITF
jgi:perosamine synthetase